MRALNFPTALFALSLLLLGACASGELVPRPGYDAVPTGDSTGGSSGERDTGETDPGDDVADTDNGELPEEDTNGTGDTGGDDTGTTPGDDVDDASDTEEEDTDDTDETPPIVGDWATRWENAFTANPKVEATSEASYQAMVAYCNCCSENFDNNKESCFNLQFGGGFRVNDCSASVFNSQADKANNWLDCMESAWTTLASCVSCSEDACTRCGNAFANAMLDCRSESQTFYRLIDVCYEDED